MRPLIYSLVIASLGAGCALEDETPDTSETVSAIHCPDPDHCTLVNGSGVYTEEFGFAGIGADDLMLMRFINQDGFVNMRGIYHDVATNTLQYATILINGVDYLGNSYDAVSVDETLTNPTWNLVATGTGAPLQVSGADVANLQIHFKHLGEITLSFNGYEAPTPGNVPIWTYNMLWSRNGSAPVQYCFRALPPYGSGQSDSVVFQAGIGVDPIDADVARNAAFVTLSCRRGGPATVRAWGYKYRGTLSQTDLFDMGLKMKRASYCGDASFYTLPNTPILITDDLAINSTATTDPDQIEASWGKVNGTFRATCVNLLKRRHRHAKFPPPYGAEFTRDCPDGFHVPDCSSLDRMVSQANPPAD